MVPVNPHLLSPLSLRSWKRLHYKLEIMDDVIQNIFGFGEEKYKTIEDGCIIKTMSLFLTLSWSFLRIPGDYKTKHHTKRMAPHMKYSKQPYPRIGCFSCASKTECRTTTKCSSPKLDISTYPTKTLIHIMLTIPFNQRRLHTSLL